MLLRSVTYLMNLLCNTAAYRFNQLHRFIILIVFIPNIHAQELKEVRIGAILPLSGSTSVYSIEHLRAIEILQSAEFNNDAKYKFVFEAQDGACGIGNSSVTAAQYLINNKKVTALIVGCSGEVLQVAPIAEREKIPVMAINAGSPEVRNAGQYIYRTYPDLTSGAALLVKHIKHQNFKKVVLLTEINSFTSSIRALLKNNLMEELIFDEEFSPDETNYSSTITRAKSKKPDAYYLNMANPTSYQNMIKQLKRMGIDEPKMTYYMAKDKASLKNLQLQQEGVVFLDLPDFEGASSNYNKFIEAYKIRFTNGIQSPMLLSVAYNGITAIIQAIKTVGTNAEDIKKFLDESEVETATGSNRFDDHGDLIGPSYILRVIKNGVPEKLR